MEKKQIYWLGPVREADDFGDVITDTFIDGKTIMGPWACMTPVSFSKVGIFGQVYQKTKNNQWPKISDIRRP